jgi:phosphatidylglycerol:prolipoprotein diacylglycerol transferase
MYPLLDRIGPFLIYTYTVVLGIGILASTGLTGWLAKKQHTEKWFDAVLVCLVAGLIGGRFGFVWVNWDYFQEHPSSIWKVWQGGYSYFGALVAGILGLWLWSLITGYSFTTYSDLLAPGFALLSAFGWLACWYEGCAYGMETTIGFFSADLPDEFSIFAVRYQTQMMGLIWSLLIFVFALLTRTRWHTGQLFCLTLGLVSFGYMGISLLMGDAVPLVSSVRLDTIMHGVVAFISALFLLKYQNQSSIS